MGLGSISVSNTFYSNIHISTATPYRPYHSPFAFAVSPYIRPSASPFDKSIRPAPASRTERTKTSPFPFQDPYQPVRFATILVIFTTLLFSLLYAITYILSSSGALICLDASWIFECTTCSPQVLRLRRCESPICVLVSALTHL